MKKIDKHEGFVKGISWDPAGKYLASQVYVDKWEMEQRITVVHSLMIKWSRSGERLIGDWKQVSKVHSLMHLEQLYIED